MFNIWKKQSSEDANSSSSSEKLTWDKSALQALAQSVAQAPVPSMLKGRVKAELSKAAEEIARKEGKTLVTAQHLMAGILSRLPEDMKKKVESAAKEGPEGLKKLQDELQ